MKMRRFNFNYKTFIFGFLALPLVFLFVTSCFDITGVTQPASAKVGETITITVNVNGSTETESDQNYKFLRLGMLAPKSWDVANKATVRFDSDVVIDAARPGSGPMIVDGGDTNFWGEKSKGLDGENSGNTVVDDMNTILDIGENYGESEWVAFRSEKPVDFGSTKDKDFTFTITVEVGPDHSGAQLGYWVGSHQNGFKQENAWNGSTHTTPAVSRHWDTFFEKIVITGAGADATDLTGPAPTFTATVAAGANGYTFDDIITINFDAKEGYLGANTALYNAGEVYMCATALLGDGTTIAKVDRSASAKMTLSGADTWTKTIWPPAYFGVSNQIITEIHLNFQNADGSIVVKNPGYGTDMVFGEKCQ